MTKYYIYVVMMVFLAGCNSPNLMPITQPPVAVQYSAAGKMLDRMDVIELRSLAQRGGVRVEVSNTICTLTGTGFATTIRPPAYVSVPLYYGHTGPITLQCRAGTNMQAAPVSTVIRAVNLSAPANEGLRIKTGTSGTQIGATISLRNRNLDRFDYPNNVSVVFNIGS